MVVIAVGQLAPASGPAAAIAGTVLLAAGFYALTAHLAARYVLGSVPVRPAVGVGVVLAVVALLLRPFGPAPVIATSLAIDVAAIKGFYRVGWRATALVAVTHYTVSAILGITLFNLVRLLATAPG
ncbi:MAG: hypothetical protein ABEJ92_12345 [Halobacteriales archaeon]